MVLCLLFWMLSACTPASDTRPPSRLSAYSATYLDETFDTVLSITIGTASSEEANTHCRAIKTLVSALHRQFDAYHTYPDMENIATVNQYGAKRPITVSADVMDLLRLGRDVYEATDGCVHIGAGALTDLWKTAIRTSVVPSPAQIESARAASTSMDGMILDEENQTVTLTDPAMKLDVGAIAKGYVLAKVYAYAIEMGIESLLFNLGGEILALGTAPNGDLWEVAVADPDGGTLERIRVRDVVVASGGDYERGFVADGIRYHHIIHPSTGYPADAHRAATVILPMEQARLSDAYCTALIILSRQDGDELMATCPNAAYLWVSPDRTVQRSETWMQYASKSQ